jgi:hypothetical protein
LSESMAHSDVEIIPDSDGDGRITDHRGVVMNLLIG